MFTETRLGISNIKQAPSISNRFNNSFSQNDNSSDISKSETDYLCSDPVENMGYGSAATRDETTDSEFDTRKGCDIYSDDYNYASETDEENAKKVKTFFFYQALLGARNNLPGRVLQKAVPKLLETS